MANQFGDKSSPTTIAGQTLKLDIPNIGLVGYVLTAVNEDGTVEFRPASNKSFQSIRVGETITLPEGQQAEVVNVGDSNNLILKFSIPKGDKGDKGDSGADGQAPTIGANGNWLINGVDTGLPSSGINGTNGSNGHTPYIGGNGNWWINGADTGNPSRGSDGVDGHSPSVIGGYWYVGSNNTGVKAQGPKGDEGDSVRNRGTWIDSEQYYPLDIVNYAGSSWICTSTNIGKFPEISTSYWDVIAEKGGKGDEGDKGDPGDEGPRGPIGAEWLGEWFSGANYPAGSLVKYNGVVYISNYDNNQNKRPDTSPEWDLFSDKGDTGPEGPPGPEGDPGAPGAAGRSAGLRYILDKTGSGSSGITNGLIRGSTPLSNPTTVTRIYISNYDVSGIDLRNLIDSWGDGGKLFIKGYPEDEIYIYEVSNAFYTGGSYMTLDVSWVSGSDTGNTIEHSEEILLEYYAAGPKGDKGDEGDKGDKGDPGDSAGGFGDVYSYTATSTKWVRIATNNGAYLSSCMLNVYCEESSYRSSARFFVSVSSNSNPSITQLGFSSEVSKPFSAIRVTSQSSVEYIEVYVNSGRTIKWNVEVGDNPASSFIPIDGSTGGGTEIRKMDYVLNRTFQTTGEMAAKAVAKFYNAAYFYNKAECTSYFSSYISSNNSKSTQFGTGTATTGRAAIYNNYGVYIRRYSSTGNSLHVGYNEVRKGSNSYDMSLGTSSYRWDGIYGTTGNFSGNVTMNSDARLKDNVKSLESRSDKVLELEGVQYTRNDLEDKEQVYFGFIADKVAEVFPELVTESDDKRKTKKLDYSGLIAPLVEKVKSQQSEIDLLKEILKRNGIT